MLKDTYNKIIDLIEKDNECPISNIGKDFGFNPVDDKTEGEFYRAELSDGKEKIIIYITGSDHSGELKYREDTVHNVIKYIDAEGNITSKEYMYYSE